MSETTIIPAELNQLVLWHVHQQDARTSLLESVMAATFNIEQPRKVMPIDLDDLRKTQRRVTALLGVPNMPAYSERSPRLAGIPTVCSVCERLDPHRLSEQKRLDKRCVHRGYSPNPLLRTSFPDSPLEITQVSLRYNQGQGHIYGINQLVDGTFSDRGKHSVLPPIGRPNTAWDDEDETNSQGVHQDSEPVNLPNIGTDSPSSSKTGAQGRDKNDDMGGEIVEGPHGLSDEVGHQGLDVTLDPLSLQRAYTLESERTGASLKIDEDYVPMSVTVRKVANMDLEKTGDSPYKEYDGFLSAPSSAGSASSSKQRHRPVYSSSRQSSEQSFVFVRDNTRESASYFLSRDGHGKDPRDGHGKDPLIVSQIMSREGTETSISKQPNSIKSSTASIGQQSKNSSSGKTSQSKDSSNSISGKTKPLRVRFSHDNISLPRRDLELEEELVEDKESGSTGVTGEVKTPEKDDQKQQKSKEKLCSTVELPKIDPDIHKKAYEMAVRDAHLQDLGIAGGSYSSPKKKKKKKKKSNQGDCSYRSQDGPGTIFSYFPLLRQLPHSDVKVLGLRADMGSEVKLKNAMKHVLGKVKLGDYYPGGKRHPHTAR